MIPGSIVVVDWRDALSGSGEPNKLRPAIVITSARWFSDDRSFEIVVPLTTDVVLVIDGASLRIEPTPDNGCTMASIALSWNVQTVPHRRITPTSLHVSDEQVNEIRRQISRCVDVIEA